MRIGKRLHVLKESGLGPAEECSHVDENWSAIGSDGIWWKRCDEQCSRSPMTLYTWEQWGSTLTIFSNSTPIVLWTHVDDWGQSLFQWGRGWYTIGTTSMHRPKQADSFQCISAKLGKRWWLLAYKKTMTLCTCKVNDNSLSILTHQTVTMPSDLGLSHL
jgi:hypothetical protein